MRTERDNLARRDTRPNAAWAGRAFTLVELLVVVAIILLILAIVGPGVTQMWEQRLESQAEIVVAGAVRSTQMQARTGGERGLLFYLDGDEQKIAPIRPVRTVQGNPNPIDQVNVVADVFEVTEGMTYRIPPPFRACPRNVAEPYDPMRESRTWSENEIDNRDVFVNPASPSGGNQRQCNFFTLVFGPDGRLRVGRNVLIYDPQDRTGLLSKSQSPATRYFDADGNPQPFPSLFGGSSSRLEYMLAVDAGGGVAALNFPCVDGVLVYDATYYWELPTAAARRVFIQDRAIPYYVSRLTGDIVRGPVGEK